MVKVLLENVLMQTFCASTIFFCINTAISFNHFVIVLFSRAFIKDVNACGLGTHALRHQRRIFFLD